MYTWSFRVVIRFTYLYFLVQSSIHFPYFSYYLLHIPFPLTEVPVNPSDDLPLLHREHLLFTTYYTHITIGYLFFVYLFFRNSQELLTFVVTPTLVSVLTYTDFI